MTASRPDNEAIFHAARDIPDPDRRREYVRGACGGDEARIAHVEALLAAADGPDSLLDRPAVRRRVAGMLELDAQLGTSLESPAVDWDSAATPSVSAGRFQLGEELARGGMGVVYRARDDSLGRDVAVKVLHERYLVDSLVGQRFLDEARITAQLQHPAIPPVFEVGRLSDDRPYLAMKLIKGRTLEELLKERPEPASDRGHFLAVFQQICQAVGYAHSRHIVHRDPKPANVMVGAFGEVQVMDWGLAKLLGADGGAAHEPAAGTETTCGTVIQTAREPDSATLAGSMLGTPAFMAPEQAGGELGRIDKRTDVFGLGAILCVILTGQPPYARKPGEEVRLMAIRGALADTHARLDQCGADAKLVELCRQCLSPEREARPRDAGAVAATIAGYLASVEERARQAQLERAAAEARAAEQRKRRRVQLGLAAALLVLLGVVGFGLWWRERVEATAAAERAARESRTSAGVAEALGEARARAEEAWKLVDYPERMQRATDVTVAALRRGEDFVRGEAPDEATLSELTSARREVDELARHTALINTWDANTQKFAEEATGDSWPSAERFTPHCREAFREFGLDPVHGPADEVAKAVAFSRLRDVLLGMLLEWHWHSQHLDGQGEDQCLWRVIRSARQLSGGTYARWQELLDANDVPGLVAFAASAEGLSFRSILAGAVMRDLRDAKQYAACYTFLRAATERYPHYVCLHYDLADICLAMNPPQYAEALRHSSAATVQRPDSPVCYLQLGKCYADLGSYDQAFAAFRRSIKLGRGAVAGYIYMGDALAKKKDWDGAVAALRQAIRLQPKNALAHYHLGVALKAKGDLDGAERAYREAVRLDGKHHGNAIGALAELLLSRGNLKDAIATYRKIMILDPKDASAHYHLGNVLRDQKNLDEAIACYKKAIELAPKMEPARRALRAALMDQEKLEEARAAWEQFLANDPPNHDAWYGYAELCLFLGNEDAYRRNRTALLKRFGKTTDPVVAERTARACLLLPASGEELEQAVALADRAVTLGKDHPYHHYFMAAKALAEYRLGRFESALDWGQKAGDEGVWVPTHLVLAMAHHQLGHAEEARRSLDEAVKTYDWKPRDGIIHALRREAEQLIKNGPKGKTPESKNNPD